MLGISMARSWGGSVPGAVGCMVGMLVDGAVAGDAVGVQVGGLGAGDAVGCGEGVIVGAGVEHGSASAGEVAVA
jgi:hypothetical protein